MGKRAPFIRFAKNREKIAYMYIKKKYKCMERGGNPRAPVPDKRMTFALYFSVFIYWIVLYYVLFRVFMCVSFSRGDILTPFISMLVFRGCIQKCTLFVRVNR